MHQFFFSTISTDKNAQIVCTLNVDSTVSIKHHKYIIYIFILFSSERRFHNTIV